MTDQPLDLLDMMRDPSPLLTPAETARELGVSEGTLQRWRANGDGPPFLPLGPRFIRYRRSDLAAFLAERVVRSTAEQAARERHRMSGQTRKG